MDTEPESCFNCASNGKTFEQKLSCHWPGSVLLLLAELRMVCFEKQIIWFWSPRRKQRTFILLVWCFLTSCCRFLRCSPFDEYKVWKYQVDNNTKKGGDRLSLLTRTLLLRRTKDQLDAAGKPLVRTRQSSHHFPCSSQLVLYMSKFVNGWAFLSTAASWAGGVNACGYLCQVIITLVWITLNIADFSLKTSKTMLNVVLNTGVCYAM